MSSPTQATLEEGFCSSETSRRRILVLNAGSQAGPWWGISVFLLDSSQGVDSSPHHIPSVTLQNTKLGIHQALPWLLSSAHP